MATDDQTFSTTSTSGTKDRRRRTLTAGAIILVILGSLSISVGVVLSRKRSDAESSSASNEDVNSLPEIFITGHPTLPPTLVPPPSAASPVPSLSPTGGLGASSEQPSSQPSPLTPTTTSPESGTGTGTDASTAPSESPIRTFGPSSTSSLKPTMRGETWAPVTQAPVTPLPTRRLTPAPTTHAPATSQPTTPGPTTRAPSNPPTTSTTATNPPTTSTTTTNSPTSVRPTNIGTNDPTTEASPSTSSPNTIEQLIRSVAIFGGTEFETASSYQSKALEWLLTTSSSMTISSSLDSTILVQQYALACIYFATNSVAHKYTVEAFNTDVAPAWINEEGWLVDPDHCHWFGVVCNANDEVEKLILFENRLTGSFPREATLLSSLQRLDLFDNYVWNQGEEGNAWLGDWGGSMKYLSYGSTYFESDFGIPTQIAKLTNLFHYDCSYSYYSGALNGAAFAGLDNLEFLIMGWNKYNSELPSQIVNLPSLGWLYIEGANLQGSFDFVTNLNSLVELAIDYNEFTGTIPFSGISPTLTYLSARDNNLEGPIHKSIGDLTNMEQVMLFNNLLTGTVPTEIGGLSRLQTLSLSGNELTGTMPSEICSLKSLNLTTLVVDCNEVTCSCCTDCVQARKK